jgi:hypothetical protein
LNFQHPATNRATAIALCVSPAPPGDIHGQLADRIVAFLRARLADPQTLTTWRERNRHALREFWARAPADALGVKQEFEKLLTQEVKPPN